MRGLHRTRLNRRLGYPEKHVDVDIIEGDFWMKFHGHGIIWHPLLDNLTFACQKCNGKKSDKEGIADPYVDAIDDHFFFVGHFLRGKSEKGD